MAKNTAKKTAAKKVVKKAPAKKTVAKKVAKKVVAKKPAAKKAVAKKSVTSNATKTTAKTTAKVVAKKVAKVAVNKSKAAVVKKAVAKKVAVKKAISKTVAPKTITKTSTPKTKTTQAINPPVATKNQPAKKPQPISNKVVEANKSTPTNMSEIKLKYSAEDLKEFEDIILEKLDTARKELEYIRNVLSRRNDEGTDNTSGSLKMLEDGAEVLEKESLSAMAGRLQKFILQLDNALARIKNGTYGICIVSGKLIPKERLRLVPHTQHTIEAKQQRL
jgi:RNA polymerase-binding transcription factor DksA